MGVVLLRRVFLAFSGYSDGFDLCPKLVEIGRQQSESRPVVFKWSDIYIPRQPNKNNGRSVTS